MFVTAFFVVSSKSVYEQMGERGRFMVNRTVYDAYEKKLFDNDSEKTSDQEVEALFSEIISILPNNGILYKYKSIEGFHVDELSEKYLWFSSAKHLNDNKDCAFNVNLLEDTEKIVHYFLKDDKFRKFLVDGAYKELSQKDPGLTKKDVVDCLECISKNGIKIGKPDSSINIRFLSTYFRDEVDILAVLCSNRYPRKATKYEKLNDKKRFQLVSSRNPFFIAYSILQKVKAISVLLSSRNNLCKQKTRTRNNFPGAYFSFLVETIGLEPMTSTMSR